MFGVSVSVEHSSLTDIQESGISALVPRCWDRQPWWSMPGLDRGQNRLEARESFEERTESDFYKIPRDQKFCVIIVLSLDHDEIKRQTS